MITIPAVEPKTNQKVDCQPSTFGPRSLVSPKPDGGGSSVSKNWYRSGLFGAFQHWVSPPWLAEKDRSRFDPAYWVRSAKRAGLDYLIFLSKWVDGLAFYPTRYGGAKTERDYLGEWLAEVKRQGGIKTVVYYCVEDDHAVGVLHPEWRSVDEKGEPFTLGGFYKPSLCSPYGEIVRNQLQEIVEKYGGLMDGLWIDDPYMTHSHDPYFATAFEKRFGKPRRQANCDELDAFCEEILCGIIQGTQSTLKAVNLEAVITFNWSGKWAKLADGVEKEGMRKRKDLLDFVSYEGHWPIRQTSHARLLRCAGKPFEITTTSCAGGDWIGYVPKPAGALKLEAISVLAHGGSFCYGMLPSATGQLQPGEVAISVEVGEWIQARKHLFQDAFPVTEAALLIAYPPGYQWWKTAPLSNDLWPHHEKKGASVQTPSDAPNHTVGNGLELAMSAHHILFDLLPSLEMLEKYRLLVLQDETCLSEEQGQWIREFVRRGGCLLMEGHASLLDEQGHKRADFALADVIGAHFDGYSPHEDGHYLRLLNQEVGKELVDYPVLIGGGAIHLRLAQAEALASMIEPIGNRREVRSWSEHNSPSAEPSKWPMAIQNRFGKGIVIYVAAPLGAYISNRGQVDPWPCRFAGNLLKMGLPSPLVRTDLPIGIELAMNRQKNRLVLHLINHYGNSEHMMGRFPTIVGGNVELNAKRLGGVSRVDFVDKPGPVNMIQVGDYVRIPVPEIESPSTTMLIYTG